MKKTMHPNSIANLRPDLRTPFTSETAPKGRKNAGLSINEWRNQLSEYCKDELENVLGDPKAPASKLIAAKEMLAAINGDGQAVVRVCDYTNGKALQPTRNENTHAIKPAMEQLANDPEAAALAEALVDRLNNQN